MDKDDNNFPPSREEIESQKDGVLFVPYEGVEAFGFKLNIYEFKKNYEVQFLYSNEDNLDKRMKKTINYLGTEGFFKNKKRIKVRGTYFNE